MGENSCINEPNSAQDEQENDNESPLKGVKGRSMTAKRPPHLRRPARQGLQRPSISLLAAAGDFSSSSYRPFSSSSGRRFSPSRHLSNFSGDFISSNFSLWCLDGMLFGIFVQTIVLIKITFRTDWDKQVAIACKHVRTRRKDVKEARSMTSSTLAGEAAICCCKGSSTTTDGRSAC
ncbi:hypothetical protein QYF36_025183 [Acer negundo]|nr:hypothetical protein QYF36_025183 [Acer negundo]